jgi:uncharacterized protein (TIGR02145 family)
MQDQNYIELSKGDLVVVSKYKVPNRAVIEDITETSVSLLMFNFTILPEKPGWEWNYILEKKTHLIKNGIYFNTSRCTLKSLKFFGEILRVDWQFTAQEAEFYNTKDPSTLIKPRKKSSSVNVKSFLAGKTKWMQSNLDVTQFNNGDPIPLVTEKKEWKKCVKDGLPACCYYNNDKSEFGTRGLLYNVHAVKDPRGIFPSGWRLPKEEEFRDLIKLYGGQFSAGKRLRHQKGWYEGPFMTMSDFEGLPNGMRRQDGEFEGEGYYGQWLMECDDGSFSHMILRGEEIDALIFPVMNLGNAYSIRAVKPKKELKLPPIKQGAITSLKNTKIKIKNQERAFVLFQEYAFRQGVGWRDYGQKRFRRDEELLYVIIDANLSMQYLYDVIEFRVFWHKLNRKGDADFAKACETFYSKDKRKEIFYEDIFETK